MIIFNNLNKFKMKKSLKDLELSMPSLDSLSAKTLMGGDGYASELNDTNGNWIPEVVVYPENIQSDFQDSDADLLEPDNGDDYNNNLNNYYTSDSNDPQVHQTLDKDKVKNSEPQVGALCTFAALNAALNGYGKENSLGTLGLYAQYTGTLEFSNFNGLSGQEFGNLINDYFVTTELQGKDGLISALEDNSGVLGYLLLGEDVNNDGMLNDGHAVLFTEYDSESGTFEYWDPETGNLEKGNGDGFIMGWDLEKAK
ncbi:hypothetical protein [Segatella bryantii]|uniref:hypothetical protein n=2 Tax=Segatella bryantii TaxID=77095 RepID=UPI00115FB9BF|nr:hypothetical protein [Segatella bryantii]